MKSVATRLLVLASGSPRRRELLERLAVTMVVEPVDIDESVLRGETPSRYVERLARAKAEAGGSGGDLVLGADTAVSVAGEILGKPTDADDARRMLMMLSGTTHLVMSGVSVHDKTRGRTESVVVETRVRLAELNGSDIDWYLSTDEPWDKAGSYALQGRGAAFVAAVDGSVSNVIGLPLVEARALLSRFDFELLGTGDD